MVNLCLSKSTIILNVIGLSLNTPVKKPTNWKKRQDGRRLGGHAHPLQQTQQQKKHIYRISDSHRTATNCWQKNLNSNNGKNFVTLLGKTREKRTVREGESERMGTPERELWRSKGSHTLESHLLD